MAQVPDINKVQSAQKQGAGVNADDKKQNTADQAQKKESLSKRLQEVRGQAGSGPVSSELKSLIEFLEGLLGVKAPEGDDHQKLEYLTGKVKERSPQEQIGILKELSKGFSAKQGSSLEQTVKSLKKDVLNTLKEAAKQDKGIANTLVNNKESLGQINIDKQNSGIDEVAGSNKFINVQNDDIKGVAKKPLEKSLGFMQNFADHQEGFFEDSAFRFSEFAGTSDKSKEAYRVTRQAKEFWAGESNFLQDLKSAGKSSENATELQAALVELATLQVQMGSSFDQDFANIEKGQKKDSDSSDLKSAISEKKSEIKSLHSNLA